LKDGAHFRCTELLCLLLCYCKLQPPLSY